MNNLFYFFDDYYLSIVIPIKFYEIDKVIILRERGKNNLEDFYDFKEYIENEFKDILVEDQVINHYSDIKNVIKKYSGENYAYFDGETNFNELVLFDSAKDMKIKRLMISESKGIMYEFDSNEIIEHDIKNKSFYIEDLIKSFGGLIEIDHSKIYQSEGVKKLLNWIILNYANYKRINKRVFKRNNIFINDKKHLNSSLILKRKIDDYTEYILLDMLNMLQEDKFIKYAIKEDNLFINYFDLGLKEIMKKPGTWLEALTLRMLLEMNIFNEVKTSVEFLWDDDSYKVKNELDVIAIRDQQVICISCKDTKRYGKDSFNELEIYSEKLGGDSALRILVATELSEFDGDIERAKEMDINVIVFDGDIMDFKTRLNSILQK
jgi:hypothetical protein